mgnify:CR=1 FL=1
MADAWCAAFVWPKQPGEVADLAPTNELWRQIRDGQGRVPAATEATVVALANGNRFFHWPLQFPQVFGKGGFDVVLGNPPWDALLFREEEFFALGEAVDADQAVAWGIANAKVPLADLRTRARAAADAIAAKPRAAVHATKALMRDIEAIAGAMLAEGRHFASQLRSAEAKEAFAAFAEKRAPDFSKVS